MQQKLIKWLEPGKQLRILREKEKISRIKLGLMLGVSEDTVKNYETGRTNVPEDVIKKLCEIFPVTPNYFYLPESEEEEGMDEIKNLYIQTTGVIKKKILEIIRIMAA